jgi:hypothetical protein
MIILKNNDIYLCYFNNPLCCINNYFFKLIKLDNFKIIYSANKSIEEVNFKYDDFNYYHCNLKGALNYFKTNDINFDKVILFTLLLNPYDRYNNFYKVINDSSKKTHEEFNKYVLEETHFINFAPNKFRMFDKYIINNLIRFENLENDISIFCNKYNIKFRINETIKREVNFNNEKSIEFNKSTKNFIDSHFGLDFIEYNNDYNPYYKNTFAVLMPVFNEYNYLNYFIEYHKNLGFDKFYVLIDDSSEIQNDYIIKEYLIGFVKFYRIKDIYNSEECRQIMLYANHKSKLIHLALQNIFKTIEEDYVISLGTDSFLYLNGLNIRDFLFKNKIHYGVSQIFFNWIEIFNKNIENEYNLLNELSKENYSYNFTNHFFTLCQKKHIDNLDITSHFYRSKQITNLCWCNNQIFELNKSNNFNDIVNLKKNTVIYEFGCIIHFLYRNIKDIFVKSYYNWNNDKKKISSIINKLITTNTFEKSNIGTGFRLEYLHRLKHKKCDIILKINNKFDEIYRDDNSKLFKNVLIASNINEEQLIEWFNTYIK